MEKDLLEVGRLTTSQIEREGTGQEAESGAEV